jgi:hypothetical protein
VEVDDDKAYWGHSVITSNEIRSRDGYLKTVVAPVLRAAGYRVSFGHEKGSRSFGVLRVKKSLGSIREDWD